MRSIFLAALAMAAIVPGAALASDPFDFNKAAPGYGTGKAASNEAGTITLSSTTCELRLDGRIIGDIVRQFDRAVYALHDARLRHCKAPRRIVLSSTGGRDTLTFQLAGRIAALGLMTHVPKDAVCSSACVLLWAAGSYRTAESDLHAHAVSRSHNSFNSYGDFDANYLNYLQRFSATLLTTFDLTAEFIDAINRAPRSGRALIPDEVVKANMYRASTTCGLFRREGDRRECGMMMVNKVQEEAIERYRTLLEMERMRWEYDKMANINPRAK